MKIKLFFTIFLFAIGCQLQAQEREEDKQERGAFRSGYMRIGVNSLGDDLDPSLSPKENIFKGQYGASRGYTFELGHIFYFGGKHSQGFLNLGLDWTILSLNYNKMDKWESYGQSSGAQSVMIGGEKIAAAAATKLGPVLSINLFEKVVLDARFQLAPTLRFFDLNYMENEGKASERYFNFTNYSMEDESEDDPEALNNKVAFGVAKSIGVTLRRSALGISADYITGDVKSNYEAFDASGSSAGKEKIKTKMLQLTVNFTF
jgi:hypothetical protein